VTDIDPTTLTPAQLEPMLRAWAAGLYPSEAAVELLIAQGAWLQRRDFLATLVDAVEDGWGPRGQVVPMASIDWERVEGFLAQAPSSSGEAALLRLAASLAGATGGPSLLAMTASMDEANAGRVLEALAHRFGWHERGITRTVSGTFEPGRSFTLGWAEVRA
jgi:hypothetical protein